MALDLEPNDMQVLQERIQAAFTGDDPQAELRVFVRKSLGFDIYVELSGRGASLQVFSFELVQKTIEDGTTDQLVRALFQERKGDTALREFVKRLLPDALSLVSQQEYEAALVAAAQQGVSGLERLRKNPAVAEALAEARVDLERTSTDLAVLAAYKGLHDALHEVQLKLYGQISQELAGLPNHDSADALRIHATELNQLAGKAEEVAEGLPEPPLVQPEMIWIGKLHDVATQLSSVATMTDAANADVATDKAAAVAAIKDLANKADFLLRHVIRYYPGRLNQALVQTAKRIPWSTLIDTMQTVAAELEATDSDRQPLVDAGNALDALRKEVLARVEEHELWQAIEPNFWDAEAALRQNDGQVLALWPILTEQVGAIRQMAPGDWTNDLDHFAAEFTKACPNLDATAMDPRARSALERFVYSGRLRFFNVDRELKASCQGILRLSEPLRRLVRP